MANKKFQMDSLLNVERLFREIKQSAAQDRFQEEIEMAAAAELVVTKPAADQNKLRVLIVDDDRTTAETLASLAFKWGHEVRRAYDGATGLALAAAFRPHAVLLDILMPDVSGIELAIQMRRQTRLKHCFIVAISGCADATHRSRCYAAGVDLFLTKPVSPQHVQTLLMLELERVRQLIDRSIGALTGSEFTVTY